MKKIFTLLIGVVFSVLTVYSQGTRYVDEVFTNVTKLENNLYSVNVTIITSPPSLDTLYFDLYMPAGDTCTSRPLAVVLPTGTFLPRGFIAPTGDKDDYANVKIAEGLAKRGYVAASIQYRLGWLPTAPDPTVRRSTIINAAYRGIQDLHAFIRYMNLNVVELDNPYKIDTSRVAVFGIGTGAFVGFNAAVLQQEEIYIPKFRHPTTGIPYIDTILSGDLSGEKQGLINIPNHVGYNDNFHFAFGLDGALGDSSWLEDGTSVPLVAGGNVNHPTTPYGLNPLTGEIECDMTVTAAGQAIVNVAGSICIIDKANSLGINNPLDKVDYNDPVSEKLRTEENGFNLEHLWPINQAGAQTGPWEYWDSVFWKMVPHPFGGSIHSQAILTNPGMGFEKADRYIDTALWFFSPRSFTALKLNEVVCSCEGVIPDPTIFLINDFECHKNYEFTAGRDRIMIMDNPDSESGNDSEKIGAYNDPANDPWAALCVAFSDSINLDVFNVFEVDVNSPAAGVPFLIKLEGGTSPAKEVWVNTTTSGTWETLSVNFAEEACSNHTRVCIFPNAGEDVPVEITYLLDNLRFTESGDTCQIIIGVFNPTVETLTISPNPTDNLLYIQNPGKAVNFTFVNVLGQQVLNHKTAGEENISIEVSHLGSGLYIIGAYDVDGKLIANARIMKN